MKHDLARVLLPSCPFMCIDATRPDVEVPDFLRANDLVLRVGEDPRVLGMPDLVLDARGWSGTISMRGTLYFVRVAWAAVYGMWLAGDEHGPELTVGLRVGPVEAAPVTPWLSPEPPRRGGHLRVVSALAECDDGDGF